MKGWRATLAYTIGLVAAIFLVVVMLSLGVRFRKWMLYDEDRVAAQIEKRLGPLEERIKALEGKSR